MTAYYRPIAQTGQPCPEAGLPLAGGWCWFDRVEILRRGRAPEYLPAQALPEDIRTRLTSPRPDIAGLNLTDAPRIMGILNVTPDSFSDGGHFDDPAVALRRATEIAKQGADLLDIGGESTRPGADPVPQAQEIARTTPVIAAIRDGGGNLPISLDTRKAGVAQAGLTAGADLINDVAALTHDPALPAVVARAGVPVCLMHAQGDPKTMQSAPAYDDVLLDVYDFLEERIAFAVAEGIPRNRILVDPGIGFGKTLAHNLTLLHRVSLFHSLGCPILLGASRKRFIGTIGGTNGGVPDPAARLPGSLAVALSAVVQGVQILRVHDIAETRQAVALQMAVIRGRWSE